MKKSIVKIKGDNKRGGVWCEVSGSTMELLTASLALTENVLNIFSREEDKEAVKFLQEETKKLFDAFNLGEKKND